MSERLQALGPRHDAAIRLKLDGASGGEITDALDVQTRTVYLWMGEPLVKEELARQLDRIGLAPSKQRVGGSSPPGGIAEGRFESGMAATAAADRYGPEWVPWKRCGSVEDWAASSPGTSTPPLRVPRPKGQWVTTPLDHARTKRC